MTFDDLEWPWTAKTHFVAEKMHASFLEPTAQIWMKIDPYYQRQKYIGEWFPYIFLSLIVWVYFHSNDPSFWKYIGSCGYSRGSSWRGRQMRVRLSTTAIFGDFSGYVFGIFRDKASYIIWRYANPYRPVTDCKMNDLEWPWVVIWSKNPFSASTLLQNRCVFWNPLSPLHNVNEDRPKLSAAKCRQMTLVCGHIRFMQIFAGVRLDGGRGRQTILGVVDDGNFFGNLGGYVFENVWDTASNITWRYMLPLIGR